MTEDQDVMNSNTVEEQLSPEMFEKIKRDVLDQAQEDAAQGSEYGVLHGFYNHDAKRYARAIKLTGEPGSGDTEYDENLTPEETEDIREALYSQFGASSPSDDEFERQKRAGAKSDEQYALVETPTTIPGVSIRELRWWRVLSEDIAAKHNRDTLDFAEWGIQIVKKPPTPVAASVVPKEEVEHIPGWNASEGDSYHVDENSETTEQDLPTALAMGEAGNEQRSEASTKRGNLRLGEEYYSALQSANGRTPFGRENRLNEVRFDPRFRDMWDDKELRKLMVAANREFGSRLWREEGEFERVKNEMREEARRADEEAERQEAWAKVLHINPPSEAFKQAYPRVKFGPRSLAHIEWWVPVNQEMYTQLIKSATSGESVAEDRQSLIGGTYDWLDSIKDVHGPEDVIEQFYKRLNDLRGSESATDEQYAHLYDEVMKTYAELELAKAKQEAQMLEDLRSGRASDPNYVKPGLETVQGSEA